MKLRANIYYEKKWTLNFTILFTVYAHTPNLSTSTEEKNGGYIFTFVFSALIRKLYRVCFTNNGNRFPENGSGYWLHLYSHCYSYVIVFKLNFMSFQVETNFNG